MAGKILLKVVTPDKLLLSEEVDEVVAPGSMGEIGVLPGHCHFLTTLRIGELRFRVEDKARRLAVIWGYAEVTPSKVTILAEIAEKAEDIEVKRAAAKLGEALQRLQAGGLSSEVEAAGISLEKARLMIRVADRTSKVTHV